ncbi:MAG: TerD family protein [Planctomycetaceae bacterium]|jgi:tellurium resistance protein TerD|nr:TerD family protein [Planctomycetaceae bacterium]
MAVSLSKGQNILLDKGLVNVHVGLGWDVRTGSGDEFDLDVCAFLLAANGKVRSDDGFVFYNHLESADGSVAHTGDNRTGEGEGDDESVLVKLGKVAADVQRVVFTVTIHEYKERKQNFGQVSSAFIRIVNQDTGNEEARFELQEDASTDTSFVFGELYRKDSGWKFRAVGEGYKHGLLEIAKGYGVNIG